LAALVAVLTQVVPHRVGVLVAHAHEPFWQVCGEVQTVPQAPQLLLLLVVLTQVVPHRVGLPLGHVQAPPRHVWPLLHALLQLPQLV
jgi:hypothetical protein